MNDITRDGLPDRLRALAEDEIKGISAVLSPGNSHDLLTAADEIEHLREQAKTYAKLFREVADDLDGKHLGGLELVVRRTDCATGSE